MTDNENTGLHNTVQLLANTEQDLEECLLPFLLEVGSLFDPPLSERTDIPEFARRVLEHGHVLCVRDAVDTKAIMGFYCNDMTTRLAYMTILAVKREYRRQGLARLLFGKALEMVTAAGMSRVRLRTTANHPVIKMYREFGFREEPVQATRGDSRFVMLTREI